MTESSTTTETWIERVSGWRASGERADTFSRRGGYAASTLRWWASKLKRELAGAPTAEAAPSAPEVRLARVVREPSVRPALSTSSAPAPSGGGITLEVAALGLRIAIAPGADRATLAMVFEVLGVTR